jgi:hypothetical protein
VPQNQLLQYPDMAMMSLNILENDLQLWNRYNQNYINWKEISFLGNALSGFRASDSITIRRPARWLVQNRTPGLRQVQDTIDDTVQLRLSTPIFIDIDISNLDNTIRTSMSDFTEKVMRPAMVALMNRVEFDGYSTFALQSSNIRGTTTNASLTQQERQRIYAQAAALLVAEGFQDMPLGAMTPVSMSEFTVTQSTVFNNQSAIGDQYLERVVKKFAGIDFVQTPNLRVHTVGNHGGTPVVNGANQAGKSIVISGFPANRTNALLPGDLVEFAGVLAVNPQTRLPNGTGPRTFTVTAPVSSDASGNATIPIEPILIPAETAVTGLDLGPPNGNRTAGTLGYGSLESTAGATDFRKYATVNLSPANGAAVRIIGAANSQRSEDFVYDKMSALFTSVPIYLAPAGTGVLDQTKTLKNGMSLRLRMLTDAESGLYGRTIMRMDAYYGYAMGYPQGGVRVASPLTVFAPVT